MPKKAVMIISQELFRDEEYLEPKEVLENAGIAVVTASQKAGIAKSKFGKTAIADISINDIDARNYDAILFVGGPGSHVYHKDPVAHKIAQDAVKYGKVLGAICGAPPTLAYAGVLNGKKATMFSDTGELQKGGATYTGAGVEIDGKIITATGPHTAKAWGEAIVKALSNLKM